MRNYFLRWKIPKRCHEEHEDSPADQREFSHYPLSFFGRTYWFASRGVLFGQAKARQAFTSHAY